MKDNDSPESAVTQVAALKIGETYCRAKFVPAIEFTPHLIFGIKQKLMRDLSPVIARARERVPGASYIVRSIHTFTNDLDLVVAAVVVREEAEEL